MRRREKPIINFPAIMRVVGWLLMIESFFMLIPMGVSLYFGESDWMAFTISAVLALGTGFILTTQIRPNHYGMGKREGFMLTALVWVIFSLFGMVPFMISDLRLSITDAFFEAMAGFTTTGASSIDDIEHVSHAVQLWRSIMQWIGGMGIIIFTLAVIPMLNHSGGMQMFNAEVTGITHDKLRPRISQTASSLWLIYFILSIACFLALWVGPMDWFDAVCHACATISTGGFTTLGSGVEQLSSNYVIGIITLFMFLGGVNFILIYRFATGQFSILRRNEVLRVYVFAILITLGLFALSIWLRGQAYSWEDVTIRPLFQIVSIITSTGYTLSLLDSWGYFALSLLLILMYFGGCAGSTSGGAKLDRLIVLSKYCRNEITRCIHPQSILSIKVSGKVLSRDVVTKVIAFLCIYTIIILIGGFLLTAIGLGFGDAFFSSFSCVSNVGLPVGVIGSGASTYANIPDAAKWLLSFLMMVGRLEVFTVLILFSPQFWRR